MIIRKATLNDLDYLIALRLDYLRIDYGNLTIVKEEAIMSQLKKYIPSHLADGDFIAVLAEEKSMIVSSAFLVIIEKPASLAFLTGKTGIILNVLTYPEYRHRGIAFHVVSTLINEAKSSGISQIELLATNAGKPLYKKLGFDTSGYTSMQLNI